MGTRVKTSTTALRRQIQKPFQGDSVNPNRTSHYRFKENMDDQSSTFRKVDRWAYGTKPGESGALGAYNSNARHVDHATWHGINTVVHAVKETAVGLGTCNVKTGCSFDYSGTKHQADRTASHA